MKALGQLLQAYQFFWTLESHAQQRLAWTDARKARIARDRAEWLAVAQAESMMEANPSGQLGTSLLDNGDALRKAGLL